MSKFLPIKVYLENWDKATRNNDLDARPTLFEVLRLFEKLPYFKYSQYDINKSRIKDEWRSIATANNMTFEELRGYIVDAFCIDGDPNIDFFITGYANPETARVRFEISNGDRFDEIPVYLELEWDLSDDDK